MQSTTERVGNDAASLRSKAASSTRTNTGPTTRDKMGNGRGKKKKALPAPTYKERWINHEELYLDDICAFLSKVYNIYAIFHRWPRGHKKPICMRDYVKMYVMIGFCEEYVPEVLAPKSLLPFSFEDVLKVRGLLFRAAVY